MITKEELLASVVAWSAAFAKHPGDATGKAIAGIRAVEKVLRPEPTGPLLRWGASIEDASTGKSVGSLWLITLGSGWCLSFDDDYGGRSSVRVPVFVVDSDAARRQWAERVLTAAIGARWA